MSYFKRDSVDVFPTTNRTYKIKGKFTSENNFVNILNSITDIDSYVLSYDETNGIMEVVIHGYYFVIDISDFSPRANQYLEILVENGSHSLVCLDTEHTPNVLDSETEFLGISYTTDPHSNSDASHTYYNVKLTDGNGNIISKVRFKSDSIEVSDGIDLTQWAEYIDLRKQNKLTVAGGYGIKLIEKGSPSDDIISLDDATKAKLQSIDNCGNDTTFVYFKDGIGKTSTKTVGKKASNASLTSTTMYMNGGSLQAGVSMYASSNDPQPSDGSVGDFWFKYAN